MTETPKTAIVVSGEGFKAFYNVGILTRITRDLRIVPDTIYGSSSGALIAATYASFGLDIMERLWRDIDKMTDVFAFNWLGAIWKRGLFNTSPIHRLLMNYEGHRLPPVVRAVINRQHVESSHLDYVYSDQVSFAEFMRAVTSAIAIQGLVEPVDGYCDGAQTDIVPLRQAILDGHRRIIVILGSPPFSPRFDLTWKLFPWIQIISNAVNYLIHQNMLADLLECHNKNFSPGYHNVELTIYGPNKFLGDPLDVSQKDRLYNLGLNDFVEWGIAADNSFYVKGLGERP